MKRISSRDNAQFKSLLKLSQSSRERRREGMTILDGPHLVQAYRRSVGLPRSVLLAESALEKPEIVALVQDIGSDRSVILTDALFTQIAQVVNPVGISALIDTPLPPEPLEPGEFCLAIEGLQDPGNLGSILRSAAAAGVSSVLLSRACVYAWSPRVIRAGMGAHFNLRIHEQIDLAEALGNFSGRVVVTDASGTEPIFDADLTGPLAIVVGNEGLGVSVGLRSIANRVVTIPMPGDVESLNVAAATAIALFEHVRQVQYVRNRAEPCARNQ